MSLATLFRIVCNRAACASASAIVLFSLHSQAALAATDWSAIETAMKVNGTVLPGDVLRFELVRSDLAVSVNGVAVPGVETAAVANGFVAFKETSGGQFFADGALPAQESEVPALENALIAHAHIHITSVGSRLLNESPKLIYVYFEATGTGTQLGTWLATALATIHSPQLGVIVIPGTNSVFNPASILPANLLQLYDEGFVEQLDDTFAFYLPRPLETGITVDNGHVKAETGLGVGQSFYIQVPFSGGTTVTLNIDFALRVSDLQKVESMLTAGGFTLTSQGTRFDDSSRLLYFVHATATGDGLGLGTTLYNVIETIQSDQNALGSH